MNNKHEKPEDDMTTRFLEARRLAEAQFGLAERYRKGDGVPADRDLSALWYSRAAELGHAEARNRLAPPGRASETA